MRSIYDRRIELNDNSEERLTIGSNYHDCDMEINKVYFNGNVLTKYLKITLDRKLKIKAYTTDRYEVARKDLVFNIDRHDPLYDPLAKLLTYDNCITIIDEEDRRGLKQVEIKRNNNKISVLFTNNMSEIGYNGPHKWSINVDLASMSSKLSDQQKLRLMMFFKDVHNKYLELDKHEEKPKVLAYPSMNISGVM